MTFESWLKCCVRIEIGNPISFMVAPPLVNYSSSCYLFCNTCCKIFSTFDHQIMANMVLVWVLIQNLPYFMVSPYINYVGHWANNILYAYITAGFSSNALHTHFIYSFRQTKSRKTPAIKLIRPNRRRRQRTTAIRTNAGKHGRRKQHLVHVVVHG